MRRLAYILPVAAFAVLALFFYRGLQLDPSKVPTALADKPLPAFALPPLRDGGAGLSSDDLTGRVSLLNVFASWCVPCRAEHPLLMELSETGRVAVYGINYKDKPEDARAWLAELGDPYVRIGADRDGRVGLDLGVYGVPETFVVDRAGRIRYKHIGPLTEKDMREVIVPLIERLRR